MRKPGILQKWCVSPTLDGVIDPQADGGLCSPMLPAGINLTGGENLKQTNLTGGGNLKQTNLTGGGDLKRTNLTGGGDLKQTNLTGGEKRMRMLWRKDSPTGGEKQMLMLWHKGNPTGDKGKLWRTEHLFDD